MSYRFEYSTEKKINSPTGTVLQLLQSANGLQAWWKGMPLKKQAGPNIGKGLVVAFESGGKVTETWTIERIEPNRSVTYSVEFVGFGSVKRTLSVEDTDGGALVRWSEMGNSDTNPSETERQQTIQNFNMALGMLAKACQASS